jgi:hypothetical protein
MEEYKDIFVSPTGVSTNCQVKHPIDLTLNAPNDPKPLCKDHHGFGVFLKLFWLWHFVKHFVVLLV